MTSPAPREIAAGSPGSRWLLFVLTAAFAIGFIDRQVLNLLVEPIKADIGLTDVEISLLQGLAFSGFYVLAAPLSGRLVDLWPRRRILAGALGLWSVFTGLCGLSASFTGLFAARAGLGAAESALTPTVYSWLGDTFDKQGMARAFSIVLIGPYLGGGLALLAGGSILGWAATDGVALALFSGLKPWQITFIVLSLPSAICALAVLATREAPRGSDRETRPSLRQVGELLHRRRGFYTGINAGMALLIMSIFAFPAWTPAFLIRRFGWTIGEVGWTYGLVSLSTGIVGVLAGPVIARWIESPSRGDAYVRFPALCCCGLVVACGMIWFAPSAEFALVGAGFASLCYSAPTPVAAAALQVATPNRMRGTIASIYMTVTTLAGLALAPTLVAVITQYLFADPLRVGESLAIVCGIAAAGGAVLLWRTLPAYRQILAEDAAT